MEPITGICERLDKTPSPSSKVVVWGPSRPRGAARGLGAPATGWAVALSVAVFGEVALVVREISCGREAAPPQVRPGGSTTSDATGRQQQRHAAPVAALQPASDLPPPSDPRPKRRGWDQPPEAVALVSATEAARPLVLQEAEESAKESAEERGRRFAAMRMRPRAELAGSSSDK